MRRRWPYGGARRGHRGRRARECVWLLEHPPLYTGRNLRQGAGPARRALSGLRTGRGGQFTYHGPGQRVAYVMLDLSRRRRDVRAFVCALEAWIIATLADFSVTGERREGRVGVWVSGPRRPGPDGKWRKTRSPPSACACGNGSASTAIALNVAPDLTHFSGITPCGVSDAASRRHELRDLGVTADMPDVDAALRRNFETIFGAAEDIKDAATHTPRAPQARRRAHRLH